MVSLIGVGSGKVIRVMAIFMSLDLYPSLHNFSIEADRSRYRPADDEREDEALSFAENRDLPPPNRLSAVGP